MRFAKSLDESILEQVVELVNESLLRPFFTKTLTCGKLRKYDLSDKCVGWLLTFMCEKLVGTTSLTIFEDIKLEASHICVRKGLLRSGIGGKLLQFACRKAQDLNYHALVAITWKSNKACLGMLEKQGFVRKSSSRETENIIYELELVCKFLTRNHFSISK